MEIFYVIYFLAYVILVLGFSRVIVKILTLRPEHEKLQRGFHMLQLVLSVLHRQPAIQC